MAYITGMELDERNIKRILAVWKWYLKKNWARILKLMSSYAYLYIAWVLIILFFMTGIKDCVWPLGGFFLMAATSVCFIVYVLINHLLICRIIRHCKLFLFESLLLITLCLSLIMNI